MRAHPSIKCIKRAFSTSLLEVPKRKEFVVEVSTFMFDRADNGRVQCILRNITTHEQSGKIYYITEETVF